MCVCVCVFESLTEAGVLCFGVYVSMYACEVRPGGSEPCLFVIYKGDEELRDRTRVFVSISGKDRWSTQRPKYCLNVFLSFFDLRGLHRGNPFFSLSNLLFLT